MGQNAQQNIMKRTKSPRQLKPLLLWLKCF